MNEQPQGSNSAVDSSTGRLVARIGTITERRPDEPRDFVGSYPGWLTWIPPQIKNFTHYKLRVGHDDGDADYEFPPEQRAIQIFFGGDFFLSTFNDVNNFESGRVRLRYDVEGDLRRYIGESIGEEVVVKNVTMTSPLHPIDLAIHPQPGLLLVVFLTQDSTGGRVPAWDAAYKNAPTTGLDGTADTLSTATFAYRPVAGSTTGASAWYCIAWDTGLPTV